MKKAPQVRCVYPSPRPRGARPASVLCPGCKRVVGLSPNGRDMGSSCFDGRCECGLEIRYVDQPPGAGTLCGFRPSQEQEELPAYEASGASVRATSAVAS